MTVTLAKISDYIVDRDNYYEVDISKSKRERSRSKSKRTIIYPNKTIDALKKLKEENKLCSISKESNSKKNCNSIFRYSNINFNFYKQL